MGGISLGGKKLSFGYDIFEMLIKFYRRCIKRVVGYVILNFSGEVWVRIISVKDVIVRNI